jgi:hypothetical protein
MYPFPQYLSWVPGSSKNEGHYTPKKLFAQYLLFEVKEILSIHSHKMGGLWKCLPDDIRAFTPVVCLPPGELYVRWPFLKIQWF